MVTQDCEMYCTLCFVKWKTCHNSSVSLAYNFPEFKPVVGQLYTMYNNLYVLAYVKTCMYFT